MDSDFKLDKQVKSVIKLVFPVEAIIQSLFCLLMILNGL